MTSGHPGGHILSLIDLPFREGDMSPTVKLRLGDMFDGPADLIVLPCSTVGTITGFVARRLVQHSIPHPKAEMSLGEVEIKPFEGAEHIAQFVAFAASVRGNSSSKEAIESIGRSLGSFTAANSAVKYVAAPLLGAGAGGIRSELVVAALRESFAATAAPDAMLVIHVLHQEVYDRLKGNRRAVEGQPKDAVRVFISHTSKTDEAVEWLKRLRSISPVREYRPAGIASTCAVAWTCSSG